MSCESIPNSYEAPGSNLSQQDSSMDTQPAPTKCILKVHENPDEFMEKMFGIEFKNKDLPRKRLLPPSFYGNKPRETSPTTPPLNTNNNSGSNNTDSQQIRRLLDTPAQVHHNNNSMDASSPNSACSVGTNSTNNMTPFPKSKANNGLAQFPGSNRNHYNHNHKR